MAKLGSSVVYGILNATDYLSEAGTKLAEKYAGKLSLSGTTLSLRNQEDSDDLDTQDLSGAIDDHLSGGIDIIYSNGTIDHADTSSQGDTSTSGETIIYQIDLDARGHVTNVGTRDLGTASTRDYTISSDDPSGGSDGDVWYKV